MCRQSIPCKKYGFRENKVLSEIRYDFELIENAIQEFLEEIK